ncbi:hypothetical protein ERO13_D09G150000v2 [Gossypium hirsutum]|uniref:Uncharacterized protein n=5 Tax=Gossypium TaxID=3633 RepID=A0A1U8HYW9_GOSHI|nr:uncharacterized protein LOC107891068 [Gossypium hirsutum]KAB2013613.1 hypothetical protein ES319_D09G168200v1 [Gossypium barbadense]TYG54379.1 hypothetical protein ES288_D09G184300v1 [Gossypium darwinii]TYH54600.1 hypothetical protein ES332_D09G180600v1 [Gossypium tomentosum]TYI65696.1 hypothetical protein E1A91_D09G174100v1 [Gossypium mustelinum]KAG4130530.1 hypothetical protein ERO13_D09G150000v2 [Gossypium hirsutum]
MASLQVLHATNLKQSPLQGFLPLSSRYAVAAPLKSTVLSRTKTIGQKNQKRSFTVVAAVGDVSADGTNYLIAGAAVVALVGTAFPIFFSRKDTCPECDGAGFVRKAGATLRANAARKDQAQIVCARCNGLGKLNQIDK